VVHGTREVPANGDHLTDVDAPQQQAFGEHRPQQLLVHPQAVPGLTLKADNEVQPRQELRKAGGPNDASDAVYGADRVKRLLGSGVQVVSLRHRGIGAFQAQRQHVAAGAVAHQRPQDRLRLLGVSGHHSRVGIVYVKDIELERGYTGEQTLHGPGIRPGRVTAREIRLV